MIISIIIIIIIIYLFAGPADVVLGGELAGLVLADEVMLLLILINT